MKPLADRLDDIALELDRLKAKERHRRKLAGKDPLQKLKDAA